MVTNCWRSGGVAVKKQAEISKTTIYQVCTLLAVAPVSTFIVSKSTPTHSTDWLNPNFLHIRSAMWSENWDLSEKLSRAIETTWWNLCRSFSGVMMAPPQPLKAGGVASAALWRLSPQIDERESNLMKADGLKNYWGIKTDKNSKAAISSMKVAKSLGLGSKTVLRRKWKSTRARGGIISSPKRAAFYLRCKR